MKSNVTKVFVSICAAVICVIFAGAAVAADSNSPAGRKQLRPQMEQRGEFMKELNLTEEQKKALQPIMQEQAKKFKALRDEPNLSPEQKREKMQEIRKAGDAETKKILTPEQQTKFEQMQAQRKDRMGAGMGGQGNLLEMMSQRLNLTDEQKDTLKPFIEQQKEDAKAIMNDASLTPQQRQEKMLELREAGMAEMDKVLTPEQKAKRDEMKAQVGQHRGEGDGKRPQQGAGGQQFVNKF